MYISFRWSLVLPSWPVGKLVEHVGTTNNNIDDSIDIYSDAGSLTSKDDVTESFAEWFLAMIN